MKRMTRIVLTAAALVQIASISSQAAVYSLDNGAINFPLNASDGTEPLDNWFGNVYTAAAGANIINAVDFGVFDTTPGTVASAVLYRVTGAGGNPALGATRVYTQTFTPLVGDHTNAFLQHINLTTPVTFNAGDTFLVAVFIPNVIALAPNDVYPYLIDTGTTSAGSYWDRALPNTFNLDNISGSVLLTSALPPDGSGAAPFTPGPGHLFIRAEGVPEPSALAFAGLGTLALLIFQRRKQ